MGKRMMLVQVFHLLVKALHAFIQLKAAVQQETYIAGQHTMQHAVIDQANLLEIEPISLRRFLRRDFPGKYGTLHHQPRHNGRQAKRNARHLARIKGFQVHIDAGLVLLPKQMKILMCIGQKLHGFIKYPGHKHHIGGTTMSNNMFVHGRQKTPYIAHYTAVCLVFLLTFREHLNQMPAIWRTYAQPL